MLKFRICFKSGGFSSLIILLYVILPFCFLLPFIKNKLQLVCCFTNNSLSILNSISPNLSHLAHVWCLTDSIKEERKCRVYSSDLLLQGCMLVQWNCYSWKNLNMHNPQFNLIKDVLANTGSEMQQNTKLLSLYSWIKGCWNQLQFFCLFFGHVG